LEGIWVECSDSVFRSDFDYVKEPEVLMPNGSEPFEDKSTQIDIKRHSKAKEIEYAAVGNGDLF
jgi:hypothetical protein